MTLPTIPLFIFSLGGSDRLIGLLVGLFTFSALISRTMAGNLLETYGRKIIYISGLVIFVITISSYSFISSLLFLFIVRLFQGFGWGFSGTASGTIAGDIIPPERRGEGMGIYALGANLALAIGPGIALYFHGVMDIRWLFLVSAFFGGVALFLSLPLKIRKQERDRSKTSNIKLKDKLFEVTVWKPSLLLFFITFTFGGISSFLPLHVQKQGVGGIKLYFTVYAIALLFSRFLSGRLYDRKGIAIVFIPGTILITLAMLLLAWLPNSASLLIAASLYGLGFGSIQPSLQSWMFMSAPKHRRGIATATFFSAFDLGVGLGALLFGQLSYLWGYRIIYIVSAFMVLVSLQLFFLFRLKEKQHKRSTRC